MMKKTQVLWRLSESRVLLTIAECVYGRKGTWSYEMFQFINENYFAGRLPWPLIIWGLTAHGGCVAWAVQTSSDRSRPPIINLHPSLLHPSEIAEPWGIPENWFGPSLVFDSLLHECIHVHVRYNLGGERGRSSHDCTRWVRQVNRIAPLIGFGGLRAGPAKVMRVPDKTRPLSKRGKRPTKVVRVTTGNVPFFAIAGFPTGTEVIAGRGSRALFDTKTSGNRLCTLHVAKSRQLCLHISYTTTRPRIGGDFA